MQGSQTITYEVVKELTGFCGDPSVNDGQNLCWTLAWDTDQGMKILTIRKNPRAVGDNFVVGYRSDPVPAGYCYPWQTDQSGTLDGRFRDVKKIIIEEGVTEIGTKAFMNFAGLTEVSLPRSLMYIRDQAFFSCVNLEKVSIAQGSRLLSLFEHIGFNKGSFWECPKLKTVEGVPSTTVGKLFAQSNIALEDLVGLTLTNGNITGGTAAFTEGVLTIIQWSSGQSYREAPHFYTRKNAAVSVSAATTVEDCVFSGWSGQSDQGASVTFADPKEASTTFPVPDQGDVTVTIQANWKRNIGTKGIVINNDQGIAPADYDGNVRSPSITVTDTGRGEAPDYYTLNESDYAERVGLYRKL